MKIITLAIVLLFTSISYAQDSLSVLFVGNSYIYSNDLPGMLNALTNSLGDELTYDSKTNGGFTFQSHVNDPVTYSKIESKPWDFVILQGQSQEPSFPWGQVNSNTLPPAVQLADSVYSNRYCSQAMYFMTWGREVGDPQWDSINTFYKMNDRLRLAYLRITDSAQASVAPVGSAWRYVRDNSPAIQLYSPDGSHPSVAGSYLAACTFYASIFRKSPVGASYLAGLDPKTAGILQNAAALTVLDSLEFFHLRSNEEVAIADFEVIQNNDVINLTNTSWRATDYLWDFGDGNNSTEENPSHVYLASGDYTIQLVASNECGEDTISMLVSVDVNGIVEKESNWEIRNMGNGHYELDPSSNNMEDEVNLYSSDGKWIGLIEKVNGFNYFKLDMSLYSGGIYILKLGEMTFRIVR